MKTIEEAVDKAYDQLFEYMASNYDMDIRDILVEVRVSSDGKTIRRSYRDREEWLAAEEKQ
jgi:hypothetical protein